jgi:alpha-maltose-1-phosphate synthase
VKVAVLTREYPPHVYGGAGVHVEYLTRELEKLIDVDVHPFAAFDSLPGLGNGALEAIAIDVQMAARVDGAALVHSHTWYANLGGHLAKLLHGVPHVATTHSLEPLRPWKADQLGDGGYAVSSFCERTALEGADAVVAVSNAMRADVLRVYPQLDPQRVDVIHNGIDPDEYRPDQGTDVLDRYGVDPRRPSVVFVGRIARQKGIGVLLDAAPQLDPAAQLVLCAGAPETDELAREMEERVVALQEARDGVIWIEKMLEKHEVMQLVTNATVFVVPSTYEPMGIVNLEAMACETAVVASAVGGIPEVVADGETGLLFPSGDAEALAERVNRLLAHPELAREMGVRGRERVLERFTWRAVAAGTVELYRRLVA